MSEVVKQECSCGKISEYAPTRKTYNIILKKIGPGGLLQGADIIPGGVKHEIILDHVITQEKIISKEEREQVSNNEVPNILKSLCEKKYIKQVNKSIPDLISSIKDKAVKEDLQVYSSISHGGVAAQHVNDAQLNAVFSRFKQDVDGTRNLFAQDSFKEGNATLEQFDKAKTRNDKVIAIDMLLSMVHMTGPVVTCIGHWEEVEMDDIENALRVLGRLAGD